MKLVFNNDTNVKIVSKKITLIKTLLNKTLSNTVCSKPIFASWRLSLNLIF